MGRHLSKSIRNAKIADILRKSMSFSSPSISSRNPISGAFKKSGMDESMNYHMGKKDLIPISSISSLDGLNQNCGKISRNNMKVNDDGASSNPSSSVTSSSSIDDTQHELKSATAASSVPAISKDFDPNLKSPADVHGSDSMNSDSLKLSVNSTQKSVNPGSWVELFKKNRFYSENCGRLKKVQLSQKFVDLRDSLKEDFADLCLLGSFSSAFPGKDAILKLRNSWNVSCHVHFHASKWVIFKFDNFIDMDMVLRGGPYCFFGKPMRIFKMPRFFNFSTDMFSVICVWVKFPNLPLNLWNDDDLSSICSFLGMPLYTDTLTKQRINLDYARCLIEIDVSQNLHNSIPILLADGTILHQPVVYEDLPLSCTINDHSSCSTDDVFKGGVKSELDIEMVNECSVKNAVVHEVVPDVNVVCKLKPECFRFGSLDFEEAIESIMCSKDVDRADVEAVDMLAVKVSVKNDEDTSGMKTDVVDGSLILNAENLCEKYDDSSSDNDASVLICDNIVDALNMAEIGCESVCVHLHESVVVDDLVDDFLVAENCESLGGNCDVKPVELAREEVDVDCVHRLGENLGGEDLVDDAVLDDESVDGDSQADVVVGGDGDENSAIDDDKEVDDVDVESDFIDDSDVSTGDVSVFVAPFATFDDEVVCCDDDKNSATNDVSVSKNDDDSAVVNESEFDDVSASFSGDVNVNAAVYGIAAEDIDESDDDDYDSNEVDDNDDDIDASDVESYEDIEVNAENSRNFLHTYTLKVLKEAEDGGYIKCNVSRNTAARGARGKGIILTEDDIDMDLYNEEIRLGKY